MSATDEFMAALAASLRGSRRARNRLLTEIRAHVEDAADAERSTGMNDADTEATILERLGSPQALGQAWSETHAERRRTAHKRCLGVVAASLAGVTLLGVTQHAEGGRNESPRRPSQIPVERGSAPRRHSAGSASPFQEGGQWGKHGFPRYRKPMRFGGQ